MQQLDTMSGEPAGAPATVADLGLSESVLLDLVVKHLYYRVRITPVELAELLSVPRAIASDLLVLVREEGLAEVLGQVNLLHYSFALTERGRRWAAEAFDRSRYAGPVPVPFDEYVRVLESQSVRGLAIQPTEVRAALSHLVQAPAVTEAIGAAVLSTGSVLLYGPSGNGKSTIAAAIRGMLPGSVLIPRAVDINGQTMRVFDRRLHEPLADADLDDAADPRFVRCHRPLVTLGSEFSLRDLEVHVSSSDGTVKAPPQLMANGGVLVIDDLGRQLVRPEDLLNRWIGPMASGMDRITLPGGDGVDVPFDVLLVFATNLDPSSLGDEAFERRLRHKVLVPDPDPAEYLQIMRREAEAQGVAFSESDAARYIEAQRAAGRPLRGAQPGDIIRNLVDIARFAGIEPRMDGAQLTRAAAAYFVGTAAPRAADVA